MLNYLLPIERKGGRAMSNEEKIQYYRSKTIEELDHILKDPELEESDVIIATIESNNKKLAAGTAITYTTEEVLENIFGKASMVGNS